MKRLSPERSRQDFLKAYAEWAGVSCELLVAKRTEPDGDDRVVLPRDERNHFCLPLGSEKSFVSAQWSWLGIYGVGGESVCVGLLLKKFDTTEEGTMWLYFPHQQSGNIRVAEVDGPSLPVQMHPDFSDLDESDEVDCAECYLELSMEAQAAAIHSGHVDLSIKREFLMPCERWIHEVAITVCNNLTFNEDGCIQTNPFLASVATWDRLMGNDAEHRTPTPQYVTLDKAASLAHTPKRTLEDWKQKGKLPKPFREHKGRSPAIWDWNELRPILEKLTSLKLPKCPIQ